MGTEDEATFGLIPTVARGWARKGSKPIAIIDKKPKAINVFALRTKKTFVYSFSKSKTSPNSILEFEASVNLSTLILSPALSAVIF